MTDTISTGTDLTSWLSTITTPRVFPPAFGAWLARFTGGRDVVYAEVHLVAPSPTGAGTWSATLVTPTSLVLLKRGAADTGGAVCDPSAVDVVALPLSTTARVSRVHSPAWTADPGCSAPVKLVVSDREHILGLSPEYALTEHVFTLGSTEAVMAAVQDLWAR